MALIEVKGFQKSFGDHHVHRGVTFNVEKGECYGLLGGSGVGKSLILRSLIGLEKPDAGTIKILGNDITFWDEDQFLDLRKKVAYAFQGGALFDSMNVFENLAFPLNQHSDFSQHEISDRVLKILDKMRLPGCEFMATNRLSGGMQKRVGLARAMMLEPEVILYDEPTAGLDPSNTQKIQQIILDLKNDGVTSILVTHDMPTATQVCDRIGILQNGVIVAEANIEDLQNPNYEPIVQFMKGNAL